MNSLRIKLASLSLLLLLSCSWTTAGVADLADEKKKKKDEQGQREQGQREQGQREQGQRETKSDRPAKAKQSEGLSEDEEQAAIRFAKKHQPTLASLVVKLKTRDKDAYSKAIRDLSGTSKRLLRMQERFPQRFDQELEWWKIESEIRLQAARWTVNGSERLEKSIRRMLVKRQRLRSQRLAEEKQRLKNRIEQIDLQLQQSREIQADGIDREWQKLTRRLRGSNNKTGVRKKADLVGSQE